MINADHLFILALLIFLYGLVSKRVQMGIITGPLAFIAFGMMLAPDLAERLGYESMFGELGDFEALIELMGEITLVVVLFTDAAQIRLASLRLGAAIPIRLLGIGMPLTILLGALLAWPLFPEFGVWELALLGAMLAPTDAALGQAVVSNERVPIRIRQGLSVESGLNDGIAVPLVLLFAALATINSQAGHSSDEASGALSVMFSLKQITLGPLAGLIVGGAGAVLMTHAIRRNWMQRSYQELAGIALALVAYTLAGEIGGNGFIAAFLAGIVVGNSSKEVCACLYDFAEAESQLLMLWTFFLVGLGLAWEPIMHAGWQAWVYALLSLTVVRAAPVALSMIGVGLKKETIGFLGWFGPRGLASIIFAVLVIEEPELGVPHTDLIVQVVVITVLMSALLHGVTAYPLSALYARSIARSTTTSCSEHEECPSDLMRKTALDTTND